MDVYQGSLVDEDEFDFKNVIPYFKVPFERTRSMYETLMNPFHDKIQHLPKDKRIKYTKFMMNLIAHISALSRIIENEVKDLNIPVEDLNSDIEINYIRN